MARAATTSDVFNAIAESTRREILDVLQEGDASVGELVVRLGLGQPQVSKHLRVLREVDLVRCHTAGRVHVYALNAAALRPLQAWLQRYTREINDRYDRLDDLLHEVRRDTPEPSPAKELP